MSTLVRRRQTLWLGLGVLSLALLVLAAWQAITAVSAVQGVPTVASPSWITDISDDRKLVGIANDVFFGQVSQKDGQNDEMGLPETQFSVTVLETLKGDVSGSVTVNQQGGSRSDGGEFRMEGDPNLLESGKSYLFVTRTYTTKGWETLVPGYGNLLLDVPDKASREEVLNSADANRLRERFQEAIENEIPYDRKDPKGRKGS